MTTQMTESMAEAYAIIDRAAKAGDRAPLNSDLPGGGSNAVQWLYRHGYIIVEIYAQNWRVIEMRASGARTLACPNSSQPYKILGSNKTVPDGPKAMPTRAEREATALAVTAD